MNRVASLLSIIAFHRDRWTKFFFFSSFSDSSKQKDQKGRSRVYFLRSVSLFSFKSIRVQLVFVPQILFFPIVFDLFLISIFVLHEELVLEESPKWKLLGDVLEEIECDDDKNDTKRNSLLIFFFAEHFYTDSNTPKFFCSSYEWPHVRNSSTDSKVRPPYKA